MDKAKAREALGELIKARRLELHLSQREVSEAANLAHLTVRRIEAGQKVRDLSLEAINIALDWPQGHVFALLDQLVAGDAVEPAHALVTPTFAPASRDLSQASLSDLLDMVEEGAAAARELRRRLA